MITEHLRQTVMSPMRQILKLEPTASECWKPGCSLRARGQLLCPWRGPQGGIHTCYTSGATSHFHSGQAFASSFFHDLLEHTKKNTILTKDLKKNKKKIKLFLFALKRSKPHPKPLSPDREGGRGREDGHERDT